MTSANVNTDNIIPNQLVPDRTNAIPCQYKGINFRSLLEARWAYFFDKLGLEWEYEPFELDGYIPDFVIPDNSIGGAKWCYVVDVKPFFDAEYKASVINKIVKAQLVDQVLFPLFVSRPVIEHIKVEYNTTVPVYVIGEIDTIINEKEVCTITPSICPLFTLNPAADNLTRDRMTFLLNDTENDYYWCDFMDIPTIYEEMVTRLTNHEVYVSPLNIINVLKDDRTLIKSLQVFPKDFCVSLSYYEERVNRYESYWKEACNATQYKPQKPKQFITMSAIHSVTEGFNEPVSSLDIIPEYYRINEIPPPLSEEILIGGISKVSLSHKLKVSTERHDAIQKTFGDGYFGVGNSIPAFLLNFTLSSLKTFVHDYDIRIATTKATKSTTKASIATTKADKYVWCNAIRLWKKEEDDRNYAINAVFKIAKSIEKEYENKAIDHIPPFWEIILEILKEQSSFS